MSFLHMLVVLVACYGLVIYMLPKTTAAVLTRWPRLARLKTIDCMIKQDLNHSLPEKRNIY